MNVCKVASRIRLHLFLGIYQPETLFFHFFKLVIHSQTFYCQKVFLMRMAWGVGI